MDEAEDEIRSPPGARCSCGSSPAPTSFPVPQALPHPQTAAKTIRYRSRRAGPAKTSTPPCGLGRAPPDGTGVSSRRKADSRGTAPRSASASGIWASCASNSGDHSPSKRSASNVPTALSAYHAFSFAISFSFTAAHRPFSPRQHSRPETIRQRTRNCPFSRQKKKCGFFLFE